MIRSRKLRLSLFGAGMSLVLAASAPVLAADSASANAASPEFAKAIGAAQDAVKKGKFAEASRDVAAAAALPGNNDYEKFVIEQMKGLIASQSGDYTGAIAAFSAQIDSGRLDAPTALRLTEASAGMAFQGKDYATAAVWADRYFKQGGNDPQMKQVQIEAHYLNNDFPAALRLEDAAIKAQVRAGQTPSENDFNLLYSSALNMKDDAALSAALEEAVIYYPKPEYWGTLINNVVNAPSFNSDLLGFDSFELRQATGTMKDTDTYMEAVQEALQGGHSGAAQQFYDQGTAAGMLGTGSAADIARQERLHKLVLSTVAADTAREKSDIGFANSNANQAANVGYNLIALGQVDEGIELMEKALSKGVKRENLTRLRLGQAYVVAGRKDDAIKMFNSVEGDDGAAGLAHLWVIHLKQKA